MCAGDVAHASDVYDELRGRLLAEFESWWAAHGGGEVLGGGGGGGGGEHAVTGDGDVLDDGEAFDKMESERVAAEVRPCVRDDVYVCVCVCV